MERTHDYIHEYLGYHLPGGRCRIRVYQGAGRIPVIVASELPDNPNTSITNMAEYLAPEILIKHFPERLEEDEPAIWIEHYAPPEHKGRRGKPDFSRVRFANWTPRVEIKWNAGKLVRRLKFGQPAWEYLAHQDVEQLIGQPIDADPQK
jgi:hypothetical protein